MIHVVQLLCGSRRHLIRSLAYEPGVSHLYIKGVNSVMTTDNAFPYLKGLLNGWLDKNVFNPWCGVCGASHASWFFEHGSTRFKTIEEVEPHLAGVIEIVGQSTASR